MGPKGVVGLAGALIVVLLVLSSVYIIPETHRGVMLRFGELVETDIQAGIHFKVPVIDQVREFDIRVLTMDLPSRQYLTIEKKPLDVDSYIAWKILNVDQFYRAPVATSTVPSLCCCPAWTTACGTSSVSAPCTKWCLVSGTNSCTLCVTG